MKILIVGPSDTKSHGGMATVIEDIRNSEVLNSKFDIDIFASYIDGNLLVRMCYSIYAFLKFLSVYKKYDLFHIHTASFGSTFRKYCYLKVIKRAGKKAIVHIHGAKYLIFYESLNHKQKRFVMDYLNHADLVLALSKDWKDKFDTVFHLKNCKVLENGIDAKQYAAAIENDPGSSHSFAVMGRLGERKGTYDLLNACEQVVKIIPDFKCYLAGDGEIEKVKKIIKQKGLERNIEVVGWIHFEEKLRLLKKISTVVLPSYNEGLPMSILEGMAAGKAIISTNVGAIPEVISQKNGILVEPGDIHTLSKTLIRCCQDTKMVRQMSIENIQKINNEFSLKNMHIKLAKYYEECLKL